MVNSTVDLVALRCLAHLDKEDAMLQTSWELVQQTRQALLQRDHRLLQQILQRQQETAAIAEKLRSSRQAIRCEIATCFAIPEEDASLGYLARRAPPERRDQLFSYQQRLSKAAEQVDVLNRGNVALAGQVMDLLQGVLHRLTGESPQSACYERSGRFNRQPGAVPHAVNR